MQTTIAIDAMGGDVGPKVTVPAALSFLAQSPDCRVLLVGRTDNIKAQLRKATARGDATLMLRRLEVIEAPELVEMHEDVRSAIRHKKNSSMRVAIDLVKSGIDRPAICGALPSRNGVVYVLDLGANAESTPEHLLQFAIMGAMLCAAVDGKESPSVGLLNIGSEEIKGNESTKRAGELLKASHLNFFGNVEGTDIYKGTTDVVVCDGFVGNVMLKASEGIAKMMGDFLKEEYKKSPLRKLMALISLPALNGFRSRVDHRQYNGAALLGLRGIVVKSHGSADAYGFGRAILRAKSEAEHGLLSKISTEIERLHNEGLLQPAGAASNDEVPNLAEG